jgi:hypothetical protein
MQPIDWAQMSMPDAARKPGAADAPKKKGRGA